MGLQGLAKRVQAHYCLWLPLNKLKSLEKSQKAANYLDAIESKQGKKGLAGNVKT